MIHGSNIYFFSLPNLKGICIKYCQRVGKRLHVGPPYCYTSCLACDHSFECSRLANNIALVPSLVYVNSRHAVDLLHNSIIRGILGQLRAKSQNLMKIYLCLLWISLNIRVEIVLYRSQWLYFTRSCKRNSNPSSILLVRKINMFLLVMISYLLSLSTALSAQGSISFFIKEIEEQQLNIHENYRRFLCNYSVKT